MEENIQQPSPVILLIENDEKDVFFLRRAIAKTGWDGDVRVVGSATEARAYLENAPPFRDRNYYRRPRLILSDYRLAGHTALEFVTWVRGEPSMADIPIVIISGAVSAIPPAVWEKVRPEGFIQKGADIEKLAAAVRPFLPGDKV
jgi:CheY-like chemotaxis protein